MAEAITNPLAEFEYEEIPSAPRLPFAELAAYIEPPHAILTTIPIQPEEFVITAICWMVGIKPRMVPTRMVAPADEKQRASLITAKAHVNSDQAIVFTGMAGLMVIAREIRLAGTNANVDYLNKRWQALCATLGIEDIIATQVLKREVLLAIQRNLEVWQNWIKARHTLRRALLAMTLREPAEDAPAFRKVALAQVKMVLEGFGIKSALLMDAFLSSRNRAVLIPTVCRQAIDLKRALSELKRQHGEHFPFIKIYPLAGADRLNNTNYPDLYYVTVIAANKGGGPDARSIVTNIQTQTPKNVLDRYADQDLMYEIEPDKDTLNELRKYGVYIPERLLRRLREEEEEEEGVEDAGDSNNSSD